MCLSDKIEVNKTSFVKFYSKADEDFQLWSVRTQAALIAKEVGQTVEYDLLADESVKEETTKSCAMVIAIVIQGLRYKPLRLCLGDKDNPFAMWKRLREHHSVSNLASRVKLQSKLARIQYNQKAIGDYIDGFEEILNRLAGIGSAISEDMQLAMVLSSFGDLNKSPFGSIISLLQTV